MAYHDYHHQVQAARGYLELGMPKEALDAIDPDDRMTREQLDLRRDIYRALGATKELEIMEMLIAALPE